MKLLSSKLLICFASLALAGCSQNLLDQANNRNSDISVPTGAPLNLPETTALPTPGQGAVAYEEPEIAYEISRVGKRWGNVVPKDVQRQVLPENPGQADYDRYGISRFTDDGQPKSREELHNELAFKILQAKKANKLLPPTNANGLTQAEQTASEIADTRPNADSVY
jgi:hypothetical protein